MSRTGEAPSTPRATIHKQILDAAEADPDASLEAIADEVSGASVDVVRRVFEEYGDPHHESAEVPEPTEGRSEDANGDRADHADGARTNGDEDDGDEPTERTPDPTELRDEQEAVLRLIRRQPEASQATLAEEFDVTRPTISRWVNDLPGFEWDERAAFAREVLGDAPIEAADGSAAVAAGPSSNGDGGAAADEESGAEPAAESEPAGAGVEERLAAIERRLDELAHGRDGDGDGEDGGTSGGDLDADLARRVVQACMHAERISEEEELRILKALLG